MGSRGFARTSARARVCWWCVYESVRERDGRVTWSPRDFVSATWVLSANVLALVCRPKERETRTRRLHKWIFEVKIEGSASFRLKHDRLRHRSIAARLKYPLLPLLLLLCVTRRSIRRRHSRLSIVVISLTRLPCVSPLQHTLSIFLTNAIEFRWVINSFDISVIGDWYYNFLFK